MKQLSQVAPIPMLSRAARPATVDGPTAIIAGSGHSGQPIHPSWRGLQARPVLLHTHGSPFAVVSFAQTYNGSDKVTYNSLMGRGGSC